MNQILAWLRQPTTITGIAALLATAATTIAGYLTGDIKAAGAAGALTYGVVHVLMPDNTQAATVLSSVVSDLVAAQTKPAPAPVATPAAAKA
jgi:hypothetical protein